MVDDPKKSEEKKPEEKKPEETTAEEKVSLMVTDLKSRLEALEGQKVEDISAELVTTFTERMTAVEVAIGKLKGEEAGEAPKDLQGEFDAIKTNAKKFVDPLVEDKGFEFLGEFF